MHDILPGIILTVILCASFGGTEATKKDIVFLIDTSGSIANSDVLQAVDFIYNVTKWLTIGPDDILVSVVTFDSTYDEKIKLKDYNSRAELLRNLKRLVYSKPDGGTQTDAALEFVRLNSFLSKNGGRLDANKTVVLLTDGQSSFPNKTLTQAELLKSVPNTEIFTIGIGSAVSGSNGEIRGISSDPDSYYVQHVDAFIYLCNVVPALVPKLDPLSKATAILNCPTPTTTTRSPSSGHLDIVFLIDTSGSIANSDVLQAVDFIYNVTKWLTIGPDDILVSVVTFDSTYDEKIKLKDYNSRAELLRNLKRLVYSKPDGGTQTDAALEFVRLNSFLSKNGGRLDANKTVVLLTDGQSSFPNKTLTQAELLKSVPNTEIFTIGIGSAVSGSNGEIRGISSDPDSYYVQHVDAFIYLCNVVPALVPKLDPLSKATAILNCPTPTTTTRSPSSGHLGWRSSTATPASQYQQIRTTRATPHHTEGEADIPLIVGVVLAGFAVLAAIGGGVIWMKRAYQVSPSKARQSDVPWTRQYNEAKEGQLNTKFNPASLR
ncbi:Collagen alpha-3(VI) chain [Mizuhopecten yessoensis]|uniref:Collagen alpha-3(VI) chain n=1 Tax=Mizuhopecten yessoensis TaxID=6573 RepID=A0A210QR46_MIZYE|nr:Collagen alpha-3(VI) chain [Mizuhopecten yessoensis]